jgi:hypothetical protein
LPRLGIRSLGVVLLAWLAVPAATTIAQNAAPNALPATNSPKPAAAVVTSVRVVHDRGVPALEVLSTRPVVPTVQFLSSPPRLVVDLSNARTGLRHKKIPVQQENILAIRAEQFQDDPPIMRIVLDLMAPYGYSWDEAGNRLMVRLKPPGNSNANLEDSNKDQKAAARKSPFQPPQVLSLAPAAHPAVVPVTGGAGNLTLTGKRVAAGSTLTAGTDTAVLHLTGGGEVRVCPGTTLSVTPSKNAKDLMLGMSTGALETNYSLDESADTVLTPDFRILFAGPGEFDYAISTDSHGNTCVRGLMGNTSSAIVSELMGDRVYQVKPTEQAVFRSGRIDKVDSNVPLECGCPPPVPVVQAGGASTSEIDLPPNAKLTAGDAASEPTSNKTTENKLAVNPDNAPQMLSSGPETKPLPPSQPGEVHISVDAPFVFHAKKHAEAAPAPTDEAATLPVSTHSAAPAQLAIQIQPPPAAPPNTQPKPEHHGLLRRIGRFFVHIFG